RTVVELEGAVSAEQAVEDRIVSGDLSLEPCRVREPCLERSVEAELEDRNLRLDEPEVDIDADLGLDAGIDLSASIPAVHAGDASLGVGTLQVLLQYGDVEAEGDCQAGVEDEELHIPRV